MNLDDTQKSTVKNWIQEGLKLSEIQSRIGSEFDIHLTYMEVRFLVDDLGVQLKDDPSTDDDQKKDGAASSEQNTGKDVNQEVDGEAELLPDDADLPTGPGGVSLSVDAITRPGSVISGKVTFSDGVKAEWHLDQFGRLGLSPEKEGYRPSEDDVMAFQMKLQTQLQKSGF